MNCLQGRRPMETVERYLLRQAKVPGWLDNYSARFVAEIGRIQAARQLKGAVGEIGVHMGRLFILLRLLAAPDERALALDVFHNQQLNVDGSGSGDEEQFRRNVERWASMHNVEVIRASSLNVTADEIVSKVGPCRLLSIDGGHTAECTLNDLSLAEAAATEFGVVILDDYFNPSWPDVATGAARFLTDSSTTLRPFAITPNKVYLARPTCHDLYVAELRASQTDFFEKESRMFGFAVAIFGVAPDTYRVEKRLKRWLKNSVAGPCLVAARHCLRVATGH
jgi:Methyltransferase domain